MNNKNNLNNIQNTFTTDGRYCLLLKDEKYHMIRSTYRNDQMNIYSEKITSCKIYRTTMNLIKEQL